MSRDDVTGLPVLDRERWDAEADLALGARAIDLSVVRAGATEQRRGRRTLWTGLAVAATVLGLLAVALGPWGARLLSAPVPPASAPTGLPDRVWSPPMWTPSVTEAPIGRVAAVITAPVTGGGWTRSGGTGLVLVSDDSQYRVLPGTGGGAASLSRDGRHVAWVPRNGWHQAGVAGTSGSAVLRWVDVRTGRDGEADLGVPGRPSDVNTISWSPDGRWLGVSVTYDKEGSTDALVQVGGALDLVEAGSGRVHRLCVDCANQIGFDAAGRVLLPRASRVTLPAGLERGLLPEYEGVPTTLPLPNALADGTAATPIYLGKTDSSTLGQPDDWWVVRTDPDGSTHRIPLPGKHSYVDLLAGGSGSVVLRVGDPGVEPSTEQGIRYVTWRMPIDGPDGVATAVTEVLTYAGGVKGSGEVDGTDFSVLAVSADLAATGQQVTGVAPTVPWWQPSHVRWVVAGGPSLASLLPGLAVLAFILFALYRGAQGVRRRIGWRRERLAAERAGAGQPAGETLES